MTTTLEETRTAAKTGRVTPSRKTDGATVEAPAKERMAPAEKMPVVAETPAPAEVIQAPPVHSPARKRWMKRAVAGAAIVAALVVGTRYGWSYYQWAAVHEDTDDAFIDGHVTQVSPRVSGHVLKVNVTDNQAVHAGDVLVELDPSDYQAALDEANGKLTAAQADLLASQSNVEQAKAQVTTAQAQVEQAKADAASKQAEFDRASEDLKNYTTARNSGVVSTTEWSKAQADVRTTQAALLAAQKAITAAQAQVAQAQATLQARTGQVAVSRAEVTTAQAAVERAKLNLSYTRIVAATDGRVTKKAVEPGDYVVPGQLPAMLGLVSNDVWITANFKETQLAHMKAGQPVDLKVDAYPGVKFHGHVDSVQQGSGAYFSLMPPENATGNYVKVVQRVPVKIVLDGPRDEQHLLGPGMSVVPEVAVK